MQHKELFQKLQKDRQESALIFKKPSIRGSNIFIKDIYAEKAHFIYELIQNADDAEATYIKFILQEDGLFFLHNGSIKFSISDVNNEDVDTLNNNLGHLNSICSIANSTKVSQSAINKYKDD